MKKNCFYILPVLVLLWVLTPMNLFAGDYANLDFIGFSKDGKYLAFEEYGLHDGSGFPYSIVYFVDVEKNSFVGKPYNFVIEKETASEEVVRAKAKLGIAKKMLDLKIVRGNTGKMVVSRLITDLYEKEIDDYEGGETTLFFAEIIGSAYTKNLYDLRLKSVEANAKDCEAYGYPVYKLELTLGIGKKTSVLQKDNELPKSRGCVLSYRVQNVYLYKDYIAVFLNYNTPGFEGQDMQFLVVSGKREQEDTE